MGYPLWIPEERKSDREAYLTWLTYRDEGGVVYIGDAWFIWHRFRDQGNKFIYRPIPTNMELMYRSPEVCIEEVKVVELPYIRDSKEDYSKNAYGLGDPALDLTSDEEENDDA